MVRTLCLCLVLAMACAREPEETDTDPVERADPWLDDLRIAPGDAFGDRAASGVGWFGYDDDGPVALVDLRDGNRPLGRGVVRLDPEPTVALGPETLVEAGGAEEIRLDATGALTFRTPVDGCWGQWAGGDIRTRCPDDWLEDIELTYRGPQRAGRQPAAAVYGDRVRFITGVWDGTWTPGPEALTTDGAVVHWSIADDGTVWAITVDADSRRALQRLDPGAETWSPVLGVDDLRALIDGAVDPGTFRVWGLATTADGAVAFGVSGAEGGRLLPGSGIYRLDGQAAVRWLDLTAPFAGDTRMATAGLGAQPTLTWGPVDDGGLLAVVTLEDGEDAVVRVPADGPPSVLLRSGIPAPDRWGDPLEGLVLNSIGSLVQSRDGSFVVTGVLGGEAVEAGSRYGVWGAAPGGAPLLLARTGEGLPSSSERVEAIALHGGDVVVPDLRATDPLRRRDVPDAARDAEPTHLTWGAPGWNTSIRPGPCPMVLIRLDGETDEALVERHLDPACE